MNGIKKIFGIKKKDPKDGGSSPSPNSPSNSSSDLKATTPTETKTGAEFEPDSEEPGYNDVLKRLENRRENIDAYADIMEEDDDKSRLAANAATEEQIEKEIQGLCGNRKEWCRDEEEAISFKAAMAA